MMPNGISSGFVSVTLPYFLVQQGFSVATTATIAAIGVSSNIWRFLWAPIIDLTLSLHNWYFIGLLTSIFSLLVLIIIPQTITYTSLIMIVVFVSQVAATIIMAPCGGFMANCIQENKKGQASGFFQAGNMGGIGVGAGASMWLVNTFSFATSCIFCVVVMSTGILALRFVPQIITPKSQTIKQGFTEILIGIKELAKSPVAIFTACLFLSPLASGACSYIWSSVANDWQVPTNTVALVTGFLSGIVSTLGCIIGGFICDKFGRWGAYFGAGSFMAFVTLWLSISNFNPTNYINGVLFYALFSGIANTAFSTAILKAIGSKLAATKYALISSLGNIPVVYMATFNGWLHDKQGIKAMLLGESILGLVFGIIFLFVLRFLKIRDRVIV